MQPQVGDKDHKMAQIIKRRVNLTYLEFHYPLAFQLRIYILYEICIIENIRKNYSCMLVRENALIKKIGVVVHD